VTQEVDKSEGRPKEEDVATPTRCGNGINTSKSKILAHFLKGKITFTPLETIVTIFGELEYLEGLVKLAKRHTNKKV
jgi:hypothetical protein